MAKKNNRKKAVESGRIAKLVKQLCPGVRYADNSPVVIEIKRYLFAGRDSEYIIANVPQSEAYRRWQAGQEATREAVEKARELKKVSPALRPLTKEQRELATKIGARYSKKTPNYRRLRQLVATYIGRGCSPEEVIRLVEETQVFAKRQKMMEERKAAESRRQEAARLKANPEEQQRLRDERQAARREQEEKQRRARLNSDADKETAHEYVASVIPRELMMEFRRWYVHRYSNSIVHLMPGADEFMAQHAAPVALPALISDEPVMHAETDAPVIALPVCPVKAKRQGREVTTTSRPDQADFSASVRWNCYDRCVITGASLRPRLEAAHIMPHSVGGVDDCSNGLLLRRDIHELFDKNMIAICPVTLTIHVRADALAADADLSVFHGLRIADTRQPIGLEYLVGRWETFQRLNVTDMTA
ncbi:TPA: HNH endonuclease [Klebsiella quasipneumoniae subsp. quasipneumoniae]|nr:HNH endonuclease [Klebsiella quasipneumoniae subsp. quasipneumoniae]HBR1670124.1 HNH endonuclease [Klebsiella quasipneumoniae subsp. quasipneumoniae]